MSNSQAPLSPVEIVLDQLETIRSFIDKAAEIAEKNHYQPNPNSIALHEMNCFPDKSLVVDVYSRATLCFENAADHLMAFTDTLKQPAKTISPYTCVRSLLESSAITLWLLDLNIDITERVGRCFGYRYKEFEEQIKFLSSDKVSPEEAQRSINGILQRISEVETKAISLGYPKLSKNGRTTGIAIHMPETVGLVKKTLDKEQEYRLLSGIAHSYLWATRQAGFRIIELTDANGHTFKAAEKHVHPEMILFAINLVVPIFAKDLWVIGKLFGWDMQEIEGLFSHIYDKIGFYNTLRFWCQS